ncbi:MAG: hypothetical protein E6713_11610 [Sporomusaceae bacterium]|nr:hypothetical protein [Sporomusaceae bacterium]
MKKKELLMFRWGAVEYGIPLEIVTGMIHEKWLEGLAESDSIPVIRDTREEVSDTKRVILIESNGLCLALVVDEILPHTKAVTNDQIKNMIESSFSLFQFKPSIYN